MEDKYSVEGIHVSGLMRDRVVLDNQVNFCWTFLLYSLRPYKKVAERFSLTESKAHKILQKCCRVFFFVEFMY
jgi:sugar (pentulose or hexulose) kinase